MLSCPEVVAKPVLPFPPVSSIKTDQDAIVFYIYAAGAYRSCVLALEDLEKRANSRSRDSDESDK